MTRVAGLCKNREVNVCRTPAVNEQKTLANPVRCCMRTLRAVVVRSVLTRGRVRAEAHNDLAHGLVREDSARAHGVLASVRNTVARLVVWRRKLVALAAQNTG